MMLFRPSRLGEDICFLSGICGLSCVANPEVGGQWGDEKLLAGNEIARRACGI